MKEPFIKGQVLNTLPASIPATVTPDNRLRAIKWSRKIDIFQVHLIYYS